MGTSPLIARLDIKINIETKVSILIKRQDGEDLTHDFNEFSNNHSIPILGLYPAYENQVCITLTSKSGRETQLTKMITTALPWGEFGSFSPVIHDTTKDSGTSLAIG